MVPTDRIIVVFGPDEHHHQAQIEQAEAVIGPISQQDLTVCIRTFGPASQHAPIVNGKPLEAYR